MTNRTFARIIFTVLAVTGGQPAWADWGIHWKTFDLDVHVDNTGAVHVVERDDVTLSGGATTLARKFALGTDQTLVLKRFVRVAADGDHELTTGDARQPDRYYWADGVLSWGVQYEAEESGTPTMVYRLEYDLRNALAPAWDIPAGKQALIYHPYAPSLWARTGETVAAWRRDRSAITRRFRLDHDVLFATEFPATGPEDVHYVLKYDDAWRLVTPNEAMGTVQPNVDYRVTRMLEYLPGGWPPAIERWRPTARMGSIVAVVLVAVLLSIFLVLWELRKRGLSSPRVDARWLEQRIAPQRPEILAWLLDRPETGVSFAYFLDRMQKAGVLTIQTAPRTNADDDPKVQLRLLNQDAAAEPYERSMIAALFPNGAESGSDVLAEHYADSGFDPHAALQTALEQQYREEEQPTFFVWRLAWYVVLLCIVVGTILILHATLVGQAEWRVLFGSLAVGPCLAIVPRPIRRFLIRNRNALTALVSVAWAAFAVWVFFDIHMLANRPHSVEGSIGLAVYWTWCLIVLILGARTVEMPALARQKADAARARKYALDQLRRAQPALSDAWIPQLRALELGRQIEQWRGAQARDSTLPTSASQFTGQLQDGVDLDWARALRVSPPPGATDSVDEADLGDGKLRTSERANAGTTPAGRDVQHRQPRTATVSRRPSSVRTSLRLGGSRLGTPGPSALGKAGMMIPPGVMSTRCPSRAGTWLLFLFGLPFLAVGLFACFRTVALVYAWSEARRWVPTEARIESVELQSSGRTFGVRCTYTYTFGNAKHSGHRVGLDRGADNIGSWQQDKYALLKDALDAKRPVSCLVNPRDPQHAVLFGELRPGTLVLWCGFAAVFTAAGGGVAVGSLVARRRGLWRQNAREQYPDQPWMWTPRWADGVVRTGGWAGVIGVWVVGVFWNGVAWPVAVLVLMDLAAGKGDKIALLVLIFPALGLALLGAAVYATLGQRKFGHSELRLTSVPAKIGGHLQGTVIVRGVVAQVTEVQLELRCVRTITRGQQKNKRVTTTTLWQSEKSEAAQLAEYDGRSVSVPVDFAIPGECRPWNDADADDTIEWCLKASASIPGVDLALEFPVPVFAA